MESTRTDVGDELILYVIIKAGAVESKRIVYSSRTWWRVYRLPRWINYITRCLRSYAVKCQVMLTLDPYNFTLQVNDNVAFLNFKNKFWDIDNNVVYFTLLL